VTTFGGNVYRILVYRGYGDEIPTLESILQTAEEKGLPKCENNFTLYETSDSIMMDDRPFWTWIWRWFSYIYSVQKGVFQPIPPVVVTPKKTANFGIWAPF